MLSVVLIHTDHTDINITNFGEATNVGGDILNYVTQDIQSTKMTDQCSCST
jgi:hypothetical protein